MKARFWSLPVSGVVALVLFGLTICFSGAQTNQPIYTDSLQNNWVPYGWATINYADTSTVHLGSNSISVSCTNYGALYIHHNNAFDSTPYTNITFWLYVTTSGTPPLKVQGTLNGSAPTNFYQIPSLSANTWTPVTVPLSALGTANAPNMDGFWIQSESAGTIPTFYVDDITLNTNGAPANTNTVTNATANIVVNAGVNRHAISPLIYGVAFASAAQVTDLNTPLNRSGGNAETRYNWQTNAHNRANDFYYESIADSPAVAGASTDSFVSNTIAGGAKPLVTIPMIGWMPKLGPSRGKLASYSISKYGPQTGNDSQFFADAGNGVSVTNNTLITWNDPNDANFLTNVSFQTSYVQHLTNRWGVSTNGGVGYYLMDNEHSLWYSTHRDVHPVGPTMQEMYSNIIAYASMVKGIDSNALVLAPEEWGWNGYFYSGYDQQWFNSHSNYNPNLYPDRGSNGGWDYLPWMLNQIHQHDTNTGVRLLDYFTLHCYPQENNVGGNAVDNTTQTLRNQSTRQFWDTSYVDPSWINSVIMLIPRMKNWVAAYYPGTKLGITEYNWGAESSIGGATAQADIFGIFGRESLDLATRWTTPATSTPTYSAMKMYRNYDGRKSTFGDTSISATGPNPDSVATFAATRSSDNALTIMVVSKYLSGITPVNVSVSNFVATGSAQIWQLNSSNVIARLSDAPISSGTVSLTVPGQSVTLLVLPAKLFSLQAGAPRSDGNISLLIGGEIGETLTLQSSSNLVTWLPASTNILASTQLNLLLPANSAQAFYRLKQGP